MAEKPSQDELMVGLPDPIKLRLSLLLNRDLVKDIPMLKQLPIGPIIGLMQKLSSEIYLPGEFAITAGDTGGFMYFVRSGEMDLLLEDNEIIVQSLNEGKLLEKKVNFGRVLFCVSFYCILGTLVARP